MHKVQVTPLIGLPQYDGWSQVTTNDDSTLVLALAVGGLNAGNVGRDLVALISQAKPQTAAELHTLILDLLHQATTIGSQIALAASCVIGDTSMFAAYQGSVLLKRGDKLGIIISAPETVKVIEGKHTIDDVIVLATSNAHTYLGEIQQKIRQGFDTDTIVTSVVPALHSTTNSALTCLAFISFDEHVPDVGEKPLLEIELETLHEHVVAPESPSLVVEPNALPSLPTDFPLATTNQTPSAKHLSSLPVEVAISSDLTTQIQENLQPKVTQLQQWTNQLGSYWRNVLITAPRIWQQAHRWFRPLVSSGEYLTSLPKKKILQLAGLTLLLILLSTGGFLVWRRQQQNQVQAAEAVLRPLSDRFASAQQTYETDPLQARGEMEKVLDEMEALKGTFNSQPAATAAIETQIQTTRALFTQLSGRDEISSLPLFLDLRSVQSDILISEIDAEATLAALLDPEKKQVVVLDMATKQTQVGDLKSLAKVTHVSMSPQGVVILGSGLHVLSPTDTDQGLRQLKEEGDSNRDGVLVGSFGQYLYVVNPAKRNIYRYAPADDGYSDPIGWLKPGQSLPYDQLTSMAIDGDVWLGTRTGQILKLTQGSTTPFEIRGLAKPFSSSVHVYTKENATNLYVLEPASKRLVILQKTGEFIREVSSDSLAAASGVVANENSGIALVVNGSLVFEIKL